MSKKRKRKRRYRSSASARARYGGENKHHMLWMHKKWSDKP